jgi:hypothetical protein
MEATQRLEIGVSEATKKTIDMIYNLGHNEIPRRDLTIESTKEIRETIISILTEMLKESCPCQYPRFRELVTFMHESYDVGPVFCADTNYFISLSTRKETNFLSEIQRVKNEIGFDDIIYCCNKCKTIYRSSARQYSINFEFEYFQIEQANYNENLGKEVVKPFLIFQGFYGFSDFDVKTCSKDFVLADSNEFKSYMLEKK